MTRPHTFTCAWCGREKNLARTGRRPTFCSDSCRRAPKSAQAALDNAYYRKKSAEWAITHYETSLARYRAAIAAEKSSAVSAAGATTETLRDAAAGGNDMWPDGSTQPPLPLGQEPDRTGA